MILHSKLQCGITQHILRIFLPYLYRESQAKIQVIFQAKTEAKIVLDCFPDLGRHVAALPRGLERGGVSLRAALGHLQVCRGGAVDPAAVLRAAVVALGPNSKESFAGFALDLT